MATTKTKQQKVTDTVKKMTKKLKAKPKTDKDALKSLLLKDINEKKEKERLQRVEDNKNIEEFTVWTTDTVPLCKELTDRLTTEGISFVEKDVMVLVEEFNEISLITNQVSLPIIVIKGEHLVSQRDFQNVDQILSIISRIGKKGIVLPSIEIRTLEGFKNMASGFSQQLNNVGTQLNQINQKLGPIQEFIDKLKEEIESEDA
jgi:glutaredoxin